MTGRVWTRDELDQVWPLPGDWYWNLDDCGWEAVTFSGYHDEDGNRVADGWCYIENDIPDIDGAPVAVVLAVIGAHLGHDSPAWMARKLVEQADDDLVRARDEGNGSNSSIRRAARADGRAAAARQAAEMLVRGRIAPKDGKAA